MADGIPFLKPADDFTGHCNVAITGQKFVAIVGNQQADGPYTIGVPAAGADCAGVAMRDGAVGERILVDTEGILPVIAGAALVAGQRVQCDATGAAIVLAAGISLGRCMADTALGAVAPIKVNL